MTNSWVEYVPDSKNVPHFRNKLFNLVLTTRIRWQLLKPSTSIVIKFYLVAISLRKNSIRLLISLNDYWLQIVILIVPILLLLPILVKYHDISPSAFLNHYKVLNLNDPIDISWIISRISRLLSILFNGLKIFLIENIYLVLLSLEHNCASLINHPFWQASDRFDESESSKCFDCTNLLSPFLLVPGIVFKCNLEILKGHISKIQPNQLP